MKHVYTHLVVLCSILLIDIVTKMWAVTYCTPHISGVNGIACHLVYNTGIVWGMTTSIWWLRSLVAIAQALLVMVLVGYAIWRLYIGRTAFGHVCIAAGGCGNIISRILYASVIDFIVIGYGTYTWPAFNVADVAIVVGVGMLIARYEGVNVYA